MDALSLLCTLHADGPATLQRLRSLGCQRLSSFLEFDGGRLSTDLGLEPAAARRLLREGRLLADRLGQEVLEAEEAPPAATPRSAAPVVPPPPVNGVLDDGDSALVARIMAGAGDLATREPIEEALSAPVPDIPSTPQPVESIDDTAAPAPDEVVEEAAAPEHAADAERVQDEEPAPAALAAPPEPFAEPAVAEVEPPFEPEPERQPLAPDALTAGALPGLDRPMVEDLAAAGISTLGALGAAESLTLTRNLGVTFAQARRMRFLARRAADALRQAGALDEVPAAAPEPVAAAAPEREVVLQPAPEPEPVRTWTPAPPPRPVETVAQQESLEPAAMGAASGTPASPALPGEGPTPASAPAPEARRAFWEPRSFLGSDAIAEPQGVKVDPAEIEARPRIGERFASAAKNGKLSSAPLSDGRTVLGWNFEIPRPAAEEIPLASFGANGAGAPERPGTAATPGNEEDPGGDEGAGPFA